MERGVGEGGWRGELERGVGEGGWRGGLEEGVGGGGWGRVGEGLGRAWLFILQKPRLKKSINVLVLE